MEGSENREPVTVMELYGEEMRGEVERLKPLKVQSCEGGLGKKLRIRNRDKRKWELGTGH